MINARKSQHRFYLFARPSFLTGIARIADPTGTLSKTVKTYKPALSGQLTDYQALSSDWAAVGDDLRAAIQQFKDSSWNRSHGE